MCYQIQHNCKSCKKDYDCNLTNDICPTINRDVNMNLCPKCEIEVWKNELKLIDIDRYELYKDKL